MYTPELRFFLNNFLTVLTLKKKREKALIIPELSESLALIFYVPFLITFITLARILVNIQLCVLYIHLCNIIIHVDKIF